MFFNSIQFAVFLPIGSCSTGLPRGTTEDHKTHSFSFPATSFMLAGTGVVFLLVFSTFLDYFTGIRINDAKSQGAKATWLWLSLSINLGFLGAFKYYNFFATSFADGLSLLGYKMLIFSTLQVILPVGISFYTFHGLSYVIDIYNCRIKPERNFIDYSVFVSFFPLLVAGPIERATHLLPQLLVTRCFNYSKAVDGLRQILWGV